MPSALAGRFFTSEPPGKPLETFHFSMKWLPSLRQMMMFPRGFRRTFSSLRLTLNVTNLPFPRGKYTGCRTKSIFTPDPKVSLPNATFPAKALLQSTVLYSPLPLKSSNKLITAELTGLQSPLKMHTHTQPYVSETLNEQWWSSLGFKERSACRHENICFLKYIHRIRPLKLWNFQEEQAWESEQERRREEAPHS